MNKAAVLFVWLWLWPSMAVAGFLDLQVAIDPVENRLSGRAVFTLDQPGPVTFTLSDGLGVSAVEDAQGAALLHSQDGNTLTVQALGDSIALTYAGKLADAPLSQAGGRLAGAWYPAPHRPTAQHRLTLRTRAPFVAVAPGRIVKETTDGPTRTLVVQSEAPGERPTVFVGPFRITERHIKGRRLRTYFHPELSPLADAYLDDVARYLDRFEAAIGPYPFSGFAVVSGPDPVGLGYPGLTYMGRQVVRLPFIRATSLGHEVLHSWWGNGVFIDTSEGNWAEGLTTFMADYAFAEDKGADAARDMRVGWLRDYAALPPKKDRPASAFRTKTHDASQIIGYNKVAFFFHMLRDQLGQEPFNRGIRRFWTDNRFRAATWSDLRRAFEAETGHDLKTFFAQWLAHPGAPQVSLRDVRQEPGEISFTLVQSGTPYELTLVARVTADAQTRDHVITASGAETRITIPVSAPATSLTVDPDSTVFRRLAPGEAPTILRDLKLASDLLSVIVYATEAERLAAQSLVRRLVSEPPLFVQPYLSPADTDPFIVAGPADEVAAYLGTIGILDAPAEVDGRGTAQVWAGRRNGQPFLVITAERARDITPMIRKLPHYGRRGWLVFDGDQVVDKGNWPVQTGPLSATF